MGLRILNKLITFSGKLRKKVNLSLRVPKNFNGNSGKKEISPMLLKRKCKIRQMEDRKSNIAKSRNGLRNFIFDYDKIRERVSLLSFHMSMHYITLFC